VIRAPWTVVLWCYTQYRWLVEAVNDGSGNASEGGDSKGGERGGSGHLILRSLTPFLLLVVESGTVVTLRYGPEQRAIYIFAPHNREGGGLVGRRVTANT